MRKSILLLALFLSSISFVKAQKLDLIPKPVSVQQSAGQLVLPSILKIVVDKKLKNSTDYISTSLSKNTGINPIVSIGKKQGKNTISFLVDKKLDLPNEAYQLEINEKGIFVKGKTTHGVLNGLQTLVQICSAKEVKKGTVPFVKIEDYPRFDWRGMMLDCSRQFFDKQTVKNYIDWLAAHKMNVFHWHLTDDNGWRIEIKSLPDLTLKGAWRGPGEVLLPSYGSGDKRYGGFYTQEDIKEVVAYAADRGISVMPEIEIPGHSRAVTASYPEVGCTITQELKSVQGEVKNVWCVGREENYDLLDSIIKEVSELFPFEYIHIAGDEVNRANWEH
ncbi:MAG TPA: beta-N-acetylhexosaminidase, partial [Flavobacterium sp.]|nr:beta-N-acetylhexosaminidase [Flavobacterium sp.]